MKQLCRNEKGLTLVEVLASIVILSIVITTFLLVFSQTAKTTHQSEETVEATYIAQTEMENVYEMSQNAIPYTKLRENPEYTEKPMDDDWHRFEMHLPDENLSVFLSFKEAEDIGMTRVLIEVKHTASDERPIAQMENLFKWKD